MEPIFIKEFLPQQVLNLSYSYTILKYNNKRKFVSDPQTDSLCFESADPYMETLMEASTPVIEQNVGKKLWPTYSFLRNYDKGDDLKVHTDRPSCEYTVALCLGSDPVDKPYELFVGSEDENSDYKYFDMMGNYKRYRIEYKFPMLVNNAVIFKGLDNVHWREISQHDHFITVFLHYVDQEGPYKEYKFDKREMIGSKKID